MPKVLFYFLCFIFHSIFFFCFCCLAAAHFKRDATASSLTLEIEEWFVWLQCRSCLLAVYVNDIGAPCHAPSVFGSQCGSQKVAHPLRRRHVSTLFSPADTPPVGKWSSTGLPCVFFNFECHSHTASHHSHAQYVMWAWQLRINNQNCWQSHEVKISLEKSRNIINDCVDLVRNHLILLWNNWIPCAKRKHSRKLIRHKLVFCVQSFGHIRC